MLLYLLGADLVSFVVWFTLGQNLDYRLHNSSTSKSVHNFPNPTYMQDSRLRTMQQLSSREESRKVVVSCHLELENGDIRVCWKVKENWMECKMNERLQ